MKTHFLHFKIDKSIYFIFIKLIIIQTFIIKVHITSSKKFQLYFGLQASFFGIESTEGI
jgi:hypothetical protein